MKKVKKGKKKKKKKTKEEKKRGNSIAIALRKLNEKNVGKKFF